MKKALSLILVISLLISSCFAFASCGKKEIILTNENFDDYFTINVYADNYNKGTDTWGFAIANCTLTIEIIPLVNLKAENVKLTLQINPSSWEASEFYKEDGSCLMNISLPSNGEIKKIVQCSYSNLFGVYPNMPSSWIIEVSGTIMI